MSKVIEENILDIKKGIIVHQVNCRGVMGAGLAKQIKRKWPKVFNDYYSFCRQPAQKLIGEVLVTPITSELSVASLFGQDNFGRQKDKVYTSYPAHAGAWNRLGAHAFAKRFMSYVYAPFYIGAGLANGDWKEIHKIAERNIPDINWVRYRRSFEF